MDAAKLQQILLSGQAIVIYEVIVLASLMVLCVILSKKRRSMKQMRGELLAQQEKQALEDALTNKKRRYKG